MNDSCVLLNKPNVYGSIYKFDGQVSVFNYKNGPCYRCLYPSQHPPGLVPSCAEGGVLGVLPGIIGTLQANEALKVILEVGDIMCERFLLFDALSLDFSELKIHKNKECVVCGSNPSITELIDYKQFCSFDDPNDKVMYSDITAQELDRRIKEGSAPKIIDVRENFELEICKINESIHIPMNDISARLKELNVDENYVVICKSGVRSAQICDFLVKQKFKSVSNLIGGINEWVKQIDPKQQAY